MLYATMSPLPARLQACLAPNLSCTKDGHTSETGQGANVSLKFDASSPASIDLADCVEPQTDTCGGGMPASDALLSTGFQAARAYTYTRVGDLQFSKLAFDTLTVPRNDVFDLLAPKKTSLYINSYGTNFSGDLRIRSNPLVTYVEDAARPGMFAILPGPLPKAMSAKFTSETHTGTSDDGFEGRYVRLTFHVAEDVWTFWTEKFRRGVLYCGAGTGITSFVGDTPVANITNDFCGGARSDI